MYVHGRCDDVWIFVLELGHRVRDPPSVVVIRQQDDAWKAALLVGVPPTAGHELPHGLAHCLGAVRVPQ